MGWLSSVISMLSCGNFIILEGRFGGLSGHNGCDTCCMVDLDRVEASAVSVGKTVRRSGRGVVGEVLIDDEFREQESCGEEDTQVDFHVMMHRTGWILVGVLTSARIVSDLDIMLEPRECPNVALCHHCCLPGHISTECTNKSLCWNCREPVQQLLQARTHGGQLYKREGMQQLQCPKAHLVDHRNGIGGAGRSFRDVVCRSCGQMGHMSRDCIATLVCYNCGGHGQAAFECPLGRMLDHFPRRY